MAAADTPMMREYLDLKKVEPDALLLYRMGDFYECFFEDAHEAARLLELVVTSRNKGDPDPIPMAGFPYRALEAMLQRLSDAGRRVAVAEQHEVSPGVFTRELVRVVSAGLPYEGESVEAREPCYLAAVSDPGKAIVGIAVLDATTGELQLMECPTEALGAALSRVDPREVLLPEAARAALEAPGEDTELDAALRGRVRRTLEPRAFDVAAGRQRLCAQLGVADLLGFGADGLGPALGAAGALLRYAKDQARVSLSHLMRLRVVDPSGYLVLDEAARRNLELLRPLRGEGRKGALISLIDRTCTPMGGRLLRSYLLQPLVEIGALQRRQAAVERLSEGRLRRPAREALGRVADLARLCGKIAQERGNARDLLALAA
jgi:DNA mismatch repair protein MutS